MSNPYPTYKTNRIFTGATSMNFTLEQAMEKFPQIKHWQDEYTKANTTSDERLMEMPAGSCKTCEALARTVMMDQTAHDTHTAAQRQWVGLTDEAIWSEYQTLWPFHPAEEPRLAKDIAKFARAIEAKLKEKNGWYRQHVTDGSPCWCEPETSYTDPETGASVIVHKEPQ